MRLVGPALLALLVVASLALAQDQPQQRPSGPTMCAGQFGPGGGGGGQFGGRGNRTGNFTGNRTRSGNFTGNFSGNDSQRGPGGFANGIDGLELTFDGGNEVNMTPGQSTTATLAMTNNGNASLSLTLATGAFGRGQDANVTATIDPTTGSLDVGQSGTATVALTAIADAPTGCAVNVFITAHDDATNRTSATRLLVMLNAPATTASNAAAQTKASPSTQVLGVLLAMGVVAVAMADHRR